jgi:hypothetical protein
MVLDLINSAFVEPSGNTSITGDIDSIIETFQTYTLTDLLVNGFEQNSNIFKIDRTKVEYDIYSGKLKIISDAGDTVDLQLKKKLYLSDYDLVEFMLIETKNDSGSIFESLDTFFEEYNFTITDDYSFIIDTNQTENVYKIGYSGDYDKFNGLVNKPTVGEIISGIFEYQKDYLILYQLKKLGFDFSSYKINQIINRGNKPFDFIVGQYVYDLKTNTLTYGTDKAMTIELAQRDCVLTIDELVILNVDFHNYSYSDLVAYIDLDDFKINPFDNTISNVDLKSKPGTGGIKFSDIVDAISIKGVANNIYLDDFTSDISLNMLIPLYNMLLKMNSNASEIISDIQQNNDLFSNFYSYIKEYTNFSSTYDNLYLDTLGSFQKPSHGIVKAYPFVETITKNTQTATFSDVASETIQEMTRIARYGTSSFNVVNDDSFIQNIDNELKENSVTETASIDNVSFKLKNFYIIELKPEIYNFGDILDNKFDYQGFYVNTLTGQETHDINNSLADIVNGYYYIDSSNKENIKLKIRNSSTDNESSIDIKIRFEYLFNHDYQFSTIWDINSIYSLTDINDYPDTTSVSVDSVADTLTFNSYILKTKEITTQKYSLLTLDGLGLIQTTSTFDEVNKSITTVGNVYDLEDYKYEFYILCKMDSFKNGLSSPLNIADYIDKYNFVNFSFGYEISEGTRQYFIQEDKEDSNNKFYITFTERVSASRIKNSNINIPEAIFYLPSSLNFADFDGFYLKDNYTFTNGEISFELDGDVFEISDLNIHVLKGYITTDLQNIISKDSNVSITSSDNLNETSFKSLLSPATNGYFYNISIINHYADKYTTQLKLNASLGSFKVDDDKNILVKLIKGKTLDVNLFDSTIEYDINQVFNLFVIPTEYQLAYDDSTDKLSLTNGTNLIKLDYKEKISYSRISPYASVLTEDQKQKISVNYEAIAEKLTIESNDLVKEIGGKSVTVKEVQMDITVENGESIDTTGNYDDTISVITEKANAGSTDGTLTDSTIVRLESNIKNTLKEQYNKKLGKREDIDNTTKEVINKIFKDGFSVLLPGIDGISYVDEQDLGDDSFLLPEGKLVFSGKTINTAEKPIIVNGNSYTKKLDYICEIDNNFSDTYKLLTPKIKLYEINSSIPLDIITLEPTILLDLSKLNISNFNFFTGSKGGGSIPTVGITDTYITSLTFTIVIH